MTDNSGIDDYLQSSERYEEICYENLKPDDIFPLDYDIEPLHRSAPLLISADVKFRNHFSFEDEIDSIGDRKFLNSSANVFTGIFERLSNQYYKEDHIGSALESFPAAEVPYLLMPTHFKVFSPLPLVFDTIRLFLNEAEGISYDFDPSRAEVK
jgi:hypothetical protein